MKNYLEYARRHPQMINIGQKLEKPVFFKYFKQLNRKNLALIDIGCGEGELLINYILNGFLDDFNTIIGLDILETRLKRLESYPQIKKIRADFLSRHKNKAIFSSQFQLIISHQVIEHVRDDKLFLSRVREILSDDGICIISSVAKHRLAWYFYRCNGKWALDPTHLREYSGLEEFLHLFKEKGFKIIFTDEKKIFFPLGRLILYAIHFLTNFCKMPYKDYSQKTFNSKVLKIFKIPIIGYYHIEVWAKKHV